MALSWEILIVCYGLSRITRKLSYLYDNRVSDVTVSVLGPGNIDRGDCVLVTIHKFQPTELPSSPTVTDKGCLVYFGCQVT
jgi:hypothetical protein